MERIHTILWLGRLSLNFQRLHEQKDNFTFFLLFLLITHPYPSGGGEGRGLFFLKEKFGYANASNEEFEQILEDPYNRTERLGRVPGGLDLRGCRSAQVSNIMADYLDEEMTTSCPKCGGEMVEGRIHHPLQCFFGYEEIDQRHFSFSFEADIQTAKACVSCGYLEFYLKPEELQKLKRI